MACERLHLAYFQAVATIAWADNILTDGERSDLAKLAVLLRVPEAAVQTALEPPAGGPSPSLENVPTTELAQFKLHAGDIVVLTGDMARPREDWAIELESLGLVWINYVNKKVRLLAAADPDSLSGKAAKARDYGITIVSEDGLTRLITDYQKT
jgi:DNA polymerase III subunit epsilon